MQNPIDVLGAHPFGANKRRPDPRDYAYPSPEIAASAAPFEWAEGTGPDPALVALLTIKDQGASGSCGGQAFSYYGQRLRSIYANDPSARSAKFLYSQVYAPGGGSDDRDLASIAQRQGFALESDCASYGPEANEAPSESFMERPQDISALARIGAAKDQVTFAYAFPQLDIESIAQACATNHGVVLGLYGENNGTWLSAEPAAPTTLNTSNPAVWEHFMYGAQPQIYNGKKGIWCPQSWGTAAGLNGWQFLDEAYFAANAFWSAEVLVYSPTPVLPPQHAFSVNLALGESNADVLALQQYLAYDGEFNLTPTGYYGPISAQAVLRFQIKYGLASIATLDELGGNVCGPSTRAKLNSLLNI